MKSPEDMKIIQVDITNACMHKCSNCTRFCGHHKKPFYMDFETFKKAIGSLKGFNGTIGIMGGEPTLHPKFEEFVNYINENKYYPKTENMLIKPTDEFMKTVAKMEQKASFKNYGNDVERVSVQGFGLWSALSSNYAKHYELIQDTFNYQALNDHTNTMYHSPILVSRKDLGISDEEWIPIRDNCWIQNEWSATITPKGAFFCEIAGALDMLLDGPGGWPIEEGWWKRRPEDFGEQLNWCEICGIAIETFSRDANEEVDDMSKWFYERLSELESPKIKNNKYNVIDIAEDGKISEESKEGAKEVRHSKYLDNYFTRFNSANNWLSPTEIIGVAIVSENVEAFVKVLKNNINALEKFIVITSSEEDKAAMEKSLPFGDKINYYVENKAIYGTMLTKALRNLNADKNPFVVLLNTNTELIEKGEEALKKYVLNPGTILVEDENKNGVSWFGKNIDVVFSPRALALRKATQPTIARLENVEQLKGLWSSEKTVIFNDENFIYHQYDIEKDKKYVLYGCGPTAEELYPEFDDSQILCVTDSDSEKWGKDFHGHEIINPKKLLELDGKYDKIFITSKFYYEIKEVLLGMGIDASKIETFVCYV